MLLELVGISKYISRFLAITPLFILFILVGFNRDNRDYWNYEFAFEDDIHRRSIEFGYAYLVKIVKQLGGDHTYIVFMISVLLIITILRLLKSSNHINLVIFFYCAFPLIFDVNQIRNLIMYLLIVLSFVFIEKRKPIRYYLMTFLAFSFHSFSVVFLPFYYLCQRNRKTFMKILLSVTAILIVGSPIVTKILTNFFPEKMTFYLKQTPKWGVVVVLIYMTIDIFTVWWVDKQVKSKLDDKDKRRMEILYRFVWFPIITIPFLFYFLEISRLQRSTLIVKYVYCALAMKYLTFYQKLFTVLLLVLSVSVYITMVFWYSQSDLFGYLDDNYIKYLLDKYILY
ncbi:EpsG family protein [Rossellomorea marisflavi]|uniref:EpsG family protein n=1 Tax=Rossellomorea marisflavi TaxID=189381 RepID=UPI003F9FBEF7